ncbi:hypothetical protein ACFUJU_07725 [Streptomyces sp. NPDC057235]|uniref:hypothetical protein n=1 Tax=Streptomyces sp. NPDC057235 TaxID=3346058 RepID=UPI00363FC5FD
MPLTLVCHLCRRVNCICRLLSPCGTEAAYIRHIRRKEPSCAECRAAHSAHQRRRIAERAADPAAADRAGHGKATTYCNYGCRCPACAEANSRKCREARARRKAR